MPDAGSRRSTLADMTNSQGPQDDYISQEQDADIGNWGEGAIRDLFAD